MNRRQAPGRIILGAFAVVLAVLVAGVPVVPVGATDNRPAAVNKANDYIAECFRKGGDPEVDINEEEGWVQVTCSYGVLEDYCFFNYNGTTNCGSATNELSHSLPDLQDLPSLVLDPAASEGDTGSGAQAGAVAPDDEQQQNHNKSKHGKSKHSKGKHGNKGGKPRK